VSHNGDDETMLLLAMAVERLGGVLEVSDEEVAAARERYNPMGGAAPLLVGRHEDGLFAAMFTIDTLVEEGWPWYAKSADCTEATARAQLELVVAQWRATHAAAEEHRARAEAEHEANRRAGLN
jgi:hypothetical protein